MTSELPKSRNPKNASLNEKTNLFFFCPCLLIGSRKCVSYFSAPINLYIWTAIPISIYYFCQMTSKLHFSHKHLENQNKKYFSICLANTVYVTYIFLGTGLEYLWPGSTNKSKHLDNLSFYINPNRTTQTTIPTFYWIILKLYRKEFHYFLTPVKKKIQCITPIKYKSNVSAWNSS